MIKAIIFDIGGVIIKEVGHKIKKKLDKRFSNNYKMYSRLLDGGKVTLSQLDKLYKKVTGKSLKDIFVYAVRISHLNKKVKKLVFKLNKRYKVIYVSNTIKEHYLTRKKQGTYKGFLFGINSYKYKMRKPDAKIYYLALRKLKLTSEECVFIDDRKDNIKTAKKLGFHAIAFKNYSKLIKDLRKLNIEV